MGQVRKEGVVAVGWCAMECGSELVLVCSRGQRARGILLN